MKQKTIKIDKVINTEALATELILFLKKWGMWKDICIYTDKMRYSDDRTAVYKGITGVMFEENIDPEDHMKDHKGRSYANPEHIFDMTYEGPLYMLLTYGEYEPDIQEISEEGWKYIQENTDIITDIIRENHDVSSPEELAEKMWDEVFDNPKLSYWDPLEFDTWDDYKELYFEGAENTEAWKCFDTYEEYRAARDAGAENYYSAYPEKVNSRWEEMVKEARQIITEYGFPNSTLLTELKSQIYSGFSDIFEKYGLWYEFCTGWSQTCYRI
ncbi:MAG: hypothetical protein K5888_10865 [Lachnospiraceae bacterium]|nr:hypothetical protein [Lachnospiraceae bacterium]